MPTWLLELLALTKRASTLNRALGAVNLVTLTPLTIWLWTNRNEQITFTASLGFLCIIVAVAAVILELERRAPIRNGDPTDRQQQ
jgi:hypothetical protein